LHFQGAFANLGYNPGDFPVAEQAALQCLRLPMSAYSDGEGPGKDCRRDRVVLQMVVLIQNLTKEGYTGTRGYPYGIFHFQQDLVPLFPVRKGANLHRFDSFFFFPDLR